MEDKKKLIVWKEYIENMEEIEMAIKELKRNKASEIDNLNGD